MVEGIFILLAYILGTALGWHMGSSKGHKDGIVDTVDSLVEKGYLKHRGTKHNPDIIRHDEEY